MNLIDCYVTEILSEPVEYTGEGSDEMRDVWYIEVKYNGYGSISETTLWFNTKEEALSIKQGHHFLA